MKEEGIGGKKKKRWRKREEEEDGEDAMEEEMEKKRKEEAYLLTVHGGLRITTSGNTRRKGSCFCCMYKGQGQIMHVCISQERLRKNRGLVRRNKKVTQWLLN